jgi:hypothetical protein
MRRVKQVVQLEISLREDQDAHVRAWAQYQKLARYYAASGLYRAE